MLQLAPPCSAQRQVAGPAAAAAETADRQALSVAVLASWRAAAWSCRQAGGNRVGRSSRHVEQCRTRQRRHPQVTVATQCSSSSSSSTSGGSAAAVQAEERWVLRPGGVWLRLPAAQAEGVLRAGAPGSPVPLHGPASPDALPRTPVLSALAPCCTAPGIVSVYAGPLPLATHACELPLACRLSGPPPPLLPVT